MIDASQIVDALVALLRDIPELVTEMGGSAERIYAQLQARYGKFDCENRPSQFGGHADRRCWYENGADAVAITFPFAGQPYVEIRLRAMEGDVLPKRGKGNPRNDL